MTHSAPIEVTLAESATPELVEAFGKLIPQLSTSAPPLTPAAVADIIAAPATTLFIARDPTAGRRIVGTLTLVIFRIPTAIRAWIEDVVVDESARGRGVGEALVQASV
jgi:GNAT superfamily N-acetyltransferase